MSRVFFSTSVDIGTFQNLPRWYQNLNTLQNATSPRGYPNLGLYRGNQYTYQMYVYVGSGSGTVYQSYPVSYSSGVGFYTDYTCSGPYSAITLGGTGNYPQLFRYWYVPNYGVWTYTANFNLSFSDWPVVNGTSIYAVFY